jgi:CRISPR/Cas system endoribonuclease Cas6 (RAMP superfamily)
VGTVAYAALNGDRCWLSMMHTLAAFALYAGVGAGAGLGFGQCRLLPGGE